MFRQLDIFTDSKLTPEYNRYEGNQQILEENREHFNGQTKLVHDLMKKGQRVSSARMAMEYGIIDTRARIYAIKKAGYMVQEGKIAGGHGAKEWWIENND